MTPRRIVIDGMIVVVVVGLISAPYLLPQRTMQPYVQRSKLFALAPVCESQTNAGVAYGTVRMTLSNAGPTDLNCEVSFFDCRSMERLGVPSLYSLPRGIAMRSGTVTNLILVDSQSNGMVPSRVCCYGIHWEECDSWFVHTVVKHRTLGRVLRRLDSLGWISGTAPWNRCGEGGWVFNSNIGVGNYFSLVHGLDHRTFLAEEDRDSKALGAAREAAREKLGLVYRRFLAPNRNFPLPPDRVAYERAVAQASQEANQEREAAYHRYVISDRSKLRQVYEDWYLRAGGEQAELDAASNAAPPHP